MNVEKHHKVLVLPGFVPNEDHVNRLAKTVSRWRNRGLEPKIIPVAWELGNFQTKLEDLRYDIEEELEQGHEVSLLGVSAGGILAVAGFIDEPKVHKVATISSRLHADQVAGCTPVDIIRQHNPSAFEGIAWIGKNIHRLPAERRKHILNTRALFGDDLVPPKVSYLPGAKNIFMPPVENHAAVVRNTLTRDSEVLVDFLKAA